MNRKKILYIAYGCEPYVGSEQGVGWNWALGLSKFADVTVLTRENNREIINNWVEINQSTLKFIYYDLKGLLKKFKRGERGLYLYFCAWRKGVHKMCKKMDLNKYDLIWDTNFGNMFLPTYIYKYSIQSVVGPIGFGQGIRKEFAKRYNFSIRIKHFIKRKLLGSSRIVEVLASKALKSDKIICSSPWAFHMLKNVYRDKSMTVIHNGINIYEIDKMNDETNKTKSDFFNILSIGRFVDTKELEIAIKAIFTIKEYKEIKLHIIGWGTEEQRLKQLVKEYNLIDNVIFHGKQNHREVIIFMKNCKILLMPSMSEVLSTTVMEAMACRCLPLLMDIPAHTLLADETCSIKVKADTPEQAVEGFSQAILKCYNDRPMMEDMSENARKRAQGYFDWSCREKDLKEVLDFCLEKRN